MTKKAKSRSTIVSWNEIRLENVSDRKVSKDIIEISYEDLTTRCTETLDRVYSFLDLVPSESQGKIILEAEMDLKLYKKNVHGTLDKAVKAMIKDRWADYYDAFKYK